MPGGLQTEVVFASSYGGHFVAEKLRKCSVRVGSWGCAVKMWAAQRRARFQLHKTTLLSVVVVVKSSSLYIDIFAI